MRRLLVVAALLAAPATAHAFCGFYVAGGDQQMFNDATQVVLMRSGTRTVLSMQNNYKGPPEAFAMVIPVPTVLHEGDVKTLPLDVFKHVEQMGAPQLVEYWEQDPCAVEREEREYKMRRADDVQLAREEKAADKDFGVKIEAKFVVGEYQLVILSAKDSTGLDGWLKAEKYNIPKDAEPLLRPYVENNMKFFVAKVDPKKVQFVDGRAALSPLRFHYDSEQFNLPIRLGLANSSGKQDLIVNILAPHQRYEVANYKNVTIPTNINVKDSVKDKFGAFYTALFDATVEKNPGAVVTEYAWQATTCDPCPGPALGGGDFTLLGSDVIGGPKTENYYSYDFVLTRLHARYGKDITEDLQFKAADPIVGGREHVIDPNTGKLEEGAQKDSVNNFQGRYAIRHEWTGPIACQNPIRHRWGGPNGTGAPPPTPALNIALAPRGAVKLPEEVRQDIPELGLKFGFDAVVGPAKPHSDPQVTLPDFHAEKRGPKSGCGCASAGDASGGLLFFVMFVLLRRRR